MNTDKIMCADYVNNMEGKDCEKVADQWCLEHGFKLCMSCFEERRQDSYEEQMWTDRGGRD